MVDDDTGWNEVLTGVWGPGVRDAVVTRVEDSTIGARCLLVRTLSDVDDTRAGWVEQLHQLVLTAIRDETGADLDDLGSQAAWATYEDVWVALTSRWRNGGDLAVVPLRREVVATRCMRALSPLAAQAAGMDVGVDPPQPLWIDGRLRFDPVGLRRVLDDDCLAGAERLAAEELLAVTSR